MNKTTLGWIVLLISGFLMLWGLNYYFEMTSREVSNITLVTTTVGVIIVLIVYFKFVIKFIKKQLNIKQ